MALKVTSGLHNRAKIRHHQFYSPSSCWTKEEAPGQWVSWLPSYSQLLGLSAAHWFLKRLLLIEPGQGQRTTKTVKIIIIIIKMCSEHDEIFCVLRLVPI